jgi:hypothetical protein
MKVLGVAIMQPPPGRALPSPTAPLFATLRS